LWLNRYLALDVHPRTRLPALEDDVVEDAEELSFPSAGSQTAPLASQSRSAISNLRWNASPAALPGQIPTFAVGDRPAEALEIKRILSATDFATTYLAHHEHWNLDLIVKVPSPQLAEVPGAIQRIAARGEQWIAVGLHPYIASCYYLQWL